MDNFNQLLDTINKVSKLDHQLWRDIMKEFRIYNDYMWKKVTNAYKGE